MKFFGLWAEETADDYGKRDALAVLEDVLGRCVEEDMRTDHTFAALDFLAARAVRSWPFESFRRALDIQHPDGRWQNVNGSLNAIRRALAP